MFKYIKIFPTHSEYDTYINGDGVILPNVSYCVDVNEIHYKELSNEEIDPNRIVFADIEVERICVENFSSNGKYLTYQDAENVTDLGNVFQNNTIIVSFDELKYFTNYTIMSDTFSGCSNLKSITLCEEFEGFAYNAFLNCRNLEKVTLLTTKWPVPGLGGKSVPPYVEYYTFDSYLTGSSKLKIYVRKGMKYYFRNNSKYNRVEIVELDE